MEAEDRQYVRAISALFAAYPFVDRSAGDATTILWATRLRDIDIGILQQAITNLTNSQEFMPSIAAIRSESARLAKAALDIVCGVCGCEIPPDQLADEQTTEYDDGQACWSHIDCETVAR